MATLTVSVKEAITLNNIDYGSERSLDISSVNEVVKRVVTASTTECGLIGFISAISGVGVSAPRSEEHTSELQSQIGRAHV